MKMRSQMMKTTKIHIPPTDFRQIANAIRQSGVKYYPFRKDSEGYTIEFEPQNHPLVSFLILKYDGVRVQNE